MHVIYFFSKNVPTNFVVKPNKAICPVSAFPVSSNCARTPRWARSVIVTPLPHSAPRIHSVSSLPPPPPRSPPAGRRHCPPSPASLPPCPTQRAIPATLLPLRAFAPVTGSPSGRDTEPRRSREAMAAGTARAPAADKRLPTAPPPSSCPHSAAVLPMGLELRSRPRGFRVYRLCPLLQVGFCCRCGRADEDARRWGSGTGPETQQPVNPKVAIFSPS